MVQGITQAPETEKQNPYKPIYEQEKFRPKRLDLAQLEGVNDDMGKFGEGLTNFGLAVGHLIVIAFGKTKQTMAVKVKDFKNNEITYEGQKEGAHPILLGPSDSIEILQRGQKYASIELWFNEYAKWHGKKYEELEPHLGRLLSGLPVKENWQKEDGTEYYGEVRLKKDETSKTRKIYSEVNERSEKLERVDSKLGVTIDEAMWKEMESNPAGIRVDFDFLNKKGERVQMPGRLYIDTDMNQVKYRFLTEQEIKREQQKESTGETQSDKVSPTPTIVLNAGKQKSANDILISVVRHLKDQGYKNAWFDVKQPDKGIRIDEQVSIFFEDIKTLKGPLLKSKDGLEGNLENDFYKSALDIVKNQIKLGEQERNKNKNNLKVS